LFDPVKGLQQVLTNLLDNALRHTPASGVVSVSIHDGRDGAMSITITDNGDGIEADQLDDIFERFYRADPAGPSTTAAAAD